MADLFWLSDEQWAVMEPFMPTNQPGPERNDDRQVISGILHVLTSGCRWRDCPAAYGPRTTVYNRFNRWSPPRLLAGDVEGAGQERMGGRGGRHRQHLRQGPPLGAGR